MTANQSPEDKIIPVMSDTTRRLFYKWPAQSNYCVSSNTNDSGTLPQGWRLQAAMRCNSPTPQSGKAVYLSLSFEHCSCLLQSLPLSFFLFTSFLQLNFFLSHSLLTFFLSRFLFIFLAPLDSKYDIAPSHVCPICHSCLYSLTIKANLAVLCII